MSASPLANPFPGLRPFREDEEYLFFGRESQVDAMVDKLTATRFLAVVGGSGSGKSSLVNCGLRPALHRGLMVSAGSAWRMAQFRPGGDPVQALAAALAAEGLLYSGWQAEVPLREVIQTRLLASKRGLVDLWAKARAPQGTNLLVVVDQFEELFRFKGLAGGGADEQAAQATAFVNLLLETLQHPASRIHVVITMRSDFLGECARFYGLPEAINAGQYLVPRMTREERRAAIVGPVGVGGASLDPVLLTRLLNDVGDNPDQLSILQHALHRTWALWQDGGGEGALALAHYEACGTMAHALDRHAESAYAELGPAQQALCARLLRALTDKGTDARGIRRPTALAALCEIAAAPEPEVRAVLDVFRAPRLSFLMPPAAEALAPDNVLDIAHESLMRVWQRLRQWADQEAQSAALYRRLLQTAQLARAGQAELLRGAELERALDWRQRDQPNRAWAQQYGGDFDAVAELLDSSRAERDALARAQRRRWLRRVATGVVAVLALIGFTAQLWISEERVKEEAAAARRDRAAAVESEQRAQEALALAQREATKAQQAASAAEAARTEALQAREAAYRSARESVAARVLAEQKTREAEDALERASVSDAARLALQAQLDEQRVAARAAADTPPALPPARPPAPPPAPPPSARVRAISAAAPAAAPEPAAAAAPSVLPPRARAPDVTEAQLLAIMPRLFRHRSRAAWLLALNKAMADFDITTVPQRAAFLAQAAYESSEMRHLEEAWGPSEFQRRYEPPGSLAERLGNTEPGDGQRYRGRGLLHVTGRRHYEALGRLIGVDLVARPELATEPRIAAPLAAAFWNQSRLNPLADAGQFDDITRRISGGLLGQEERRRYFELAKATLKAGH